MRSGVLLSLALSLFSAESSLATPPCKPQSKSSSVLTMSSASSTSPELSLSSTAESSLSVESETASTASTATASTTTTEVASSTASITSAVSVKEPATSGAASATESGVSATQSTAETVPSTEPVTSSSVSESVAPSSTEPAEPTTTFMAVVQSGDLEGETIESDGQHGDQLLMNLEIENHSTMAFTVESSTNYLRQANGNYVCVNYGTSDYTPPGLTSCQLNGAASWFKLITCEQPVAGQPLVCTAPRGACTPGCRTTSGTPFNQFYVRSLPGTGTVLYLGNPIEEGRPDAFIPIDFAAQVYEADPPAPTW